MHLGAIEVTPNLVRFGGTKSKIDRKSVKIEETDQITDMDSVFEKAVIFFRDNDLFPLSALCFSMFGAVDMRNQIFLGSTHGSWDENVDIGSLVEKNLNLNRKKMSFFHDCEIKAFTEYRLIGEPKMKSEMADIACVNLTKWGLGVGCIVNKNIWSGSFYPEAGHCPAPRYPGDIFRGTCRVHNSCYQGLTTGNSMLQRWQVTSLENLDKEAWTLEAYYMAQFCVVITTTIAPARIVITNDILHETIRKEFLEILCAYFYREIGTFPKNRSLIDRNYITISNVSDRYHHIISLLLLSNNIVNSAKISKLPIYK